MCCCNLTKMTRAIGVFGFVISLLIVNLLATDIKRKDDENMEPTIEILFGLEWRDFLPLEDRSLPKGEILPFAIFVYALLHAATNLSLIFASISENHWFTLPWFGTQTLSIVCQIYSLHVHVIQKHDYQVELFTMAVIYIILATYFWAIVYLAQSQWRSVREYTLDENDENKYVEEKDMNNSNWDNIEPCRFQVCDEL